MEESEDKAKEGCCFICNYVIDSPEHRYSDIHRFNFVLWEFNQRRKTGWRDRNEFTIRITTDNTVSTGILHIGAPTKSGKYVAELTEPEACEQTNGVTYKFEVVAKKPIYLMKCFKLHPYPLFQYKDCGEVLSKGLNVQLMEGASYSVELTCDARNVGEYRMPLAFIFQTIDNKDTFSVIKEMVIRIYTDRNQMDSVSKKKSPFTNQPWNWSYIYTLVRPVKKIFMIHNYPIPIEIKNALMSGLKHWKGISVRDARIVDSTKKKLEETESFSEIYKNKYHHLLWLDEIGAEMKIHCYNMENVRVIIKHGNIIELTVPGLAEKRPSIIKGDEVKMREHMASVVYCGIVKEVHEEDIWIHEISPEFINRIQANPTGFLDVQFDINRLAYERMHKAIDLCSVEEKLNMLFPTIEKNKPNTNKRFKLTKRHFVNENIRENEEQQQAVMNILNATSGNVPYIVFGPPGTGKTVTIVEAIIQIVRRLADCTILVCAPANAACDMIVAKLAPHFTKEQLIRIHSETADWRIVPDIAKEYSNRREAFCSKLSGAQLQKYKVVVTTLISIGRFTNTFTATHVFIDEAAQALEPEAIIAIGGILGSRGQVILAGDPKQLGPNCNSKVAEEYGLKVSLLARLMALPLYKETNGDSEYFITTLILNYRNHEHILHLPNKLFYDSKLVAISNIPVCDQINKVILPINKSKTIQAQAVEFYGVNGQEKREGKSPSFFNEFEIQAVMKYLRALTDPTAKVVVQPEEIGVIAPYVRQVHKIRNRLPDNLEGVEIGTTETFQGREKRVIIISTVRAQASLLLHDQKYDIGFVNNPERFNVAERMTYG
ncbi:armitage [Carabus blaptoides fortunei]